MTEEYLAKELLKAQMVAFGAWHDDDGPEVIDMWWSSLPEKVTMDQDSKKEFLAMAARALSLLGKDK